MAESIPKSMSGVVFEEVGGPEVLKWKTDLPVPELKDGEVLIKNEYIGVNYIDTYFRSGLYKTDLPHVTGHEAAGVVVATHPSVSATDVKPGDSVVYLFGPSYAAYTAMPAAKVLQLPDGVATKDAAAIFLQGLTALTFIREAAGLHQTAHLGLGQGPWTLVHAGAGGTGSMFVQALAAIGAKVIATAGGPEKCEIARGHGAQWVIDNKSEDIVARVKEITNGAGVDVVFDGVGKATFDADLELIARKGTLIVVGNASGAVPPVEVRRLGAKNIRLLRPMMSGYIVLREELETYAKELFDMMKAGKLKIRIHKVYPLQDVAQAHADLEGRKTTGKLILKV